MSQEPDLTTPPHLTAVLGELRMREPISTIRGSVPRAPTTHG
jgi:hypothetical protein